jgi:magnesium chelatase family protein
MISKIYSIAVNGLESDVIEVEVDINQWLPSFTIVWLPDQWVQESKERLRSALKSSHYKVPPSRITVNLAPADIRKSWPSFDLSIAVGILAHSWDIPDVEYLQNSVFLGELSLDGSLRGVSGILPSVIGAKEKWFAHIFVPYDNYFEASIVEGIKVFPVDNVAHLVDFLNKKWELAYPELPTTPTVLQDDKYDFSYIIGQHQAKRALEIAAAGLHNIVMSWPPGSGKTLLAQTFRTILPELTLDEKIEISKIYSISWLLTKEMPLVTSRPFRIVHHTASSVSIVGWGTKARPGEISLAHKWVLFLDEVLEFPKQVLEVLRQPLEDGNISVNRANSSFTYPAKFVLLWAMNPCPCGYLTDPDKACICTMEQVKRYRSKLSGPMMDRIDIMIEVPKVKTQDFSSKTDFSKIENSASIRQRVYLAREKQLKRFSGLKITSNSQMSSKEINQFCQLDDMWENILKQAVASMNLSARAYYRILKLARTIADLDGVDSIHVNHVAEALSYRKAEE